MLNDIGLKDENIFDPDDFQILPYLRFSTDLLCPRASLPQRDLAACSSEPKIKLVSCDSHSATDLVYRIG